jgi:hypothetical protein
MFLFQNGGNALLYAGGSTYTCCTNYVRKFLRDLPSKAISSQNSTSKYLIYNIFIYPTNHFGNLKKKNFQRHGKHV